MKLTYFIQAPSLHPSRQTQLWHRSICPRTPTRAPSPTAPPPSLRACYVMPNSIAPCPTAADLADPQSVASKCHLSCPRVKATVSSVTPNIAVAPTGAGIPVSPLPGETVGDGQIQAAGSTTPLLQPIPASGQASCSGIIAQGGIPFLQPIVPGQPLQGKRPVVGEAGSMMGLKSISGGAVSASISAFPWSFPFLPCLRYS